jgi:signal transduction histidine kinase
MTSASNTVADRVAADESGPRTPLMMGRDGTVACWALDISGARTAIASIASGDAHHGWSEALLAGVRIVDVNSLAIHLVGVHLGRDRMIGEPVTSFLPREAQPVLAELILLIATKGPASDPMVRAITSLAFIEPLLTVWAAEAAFDNDIVYASISGTPIDDRSLWSIRASEQRYRNLIHHLPSALLQIDSMPMLPIFENLRRLGVQDIAAHLEATPELAIHSRNIVQVTDANMKAVQLFGADRPKQLMGAVDFLFAAAPQTAMRVIAAHFEGRRRHAEVTRIRTFDGRLRDVELTVTYPTPPERLEVTLISLEDITDRLSTEAQLRQLQADYSRAARISTLGELATSIAHEVNQPLSAIVTNAETSLRWLARPDTDLDKVAQLTGRIADSARHASDIVQRIRGMAAKHAPERVPLDLNEVVDEALLFLRHEIESRSIDLYSKLGSNLSKCIGDRIQLQQVVVNLLLNAQQALGQEGRIEIATSMGPENAVLLSVRDNGPGIAEADLGRIFDGFFSTKDDGVGIGLAICQSIIAAHGGRIEATNHPQGGALFEVSIPATVTD